MVNGLLLSIGSGISLFVDALNGRCTQKRNSHKVFSRHESLIQPSFYSKQSQGYRGIVPDKSPGTQKICETPSRLKLGFEFPHQKSIPRQSIFDLFDCVLPTVKLKTLLAQLMETVDYTMQHTMPAPKAASVLV